MKKMTGSAMKQKDLFRICVKNLYRRKGRTGLTVSGVVIGCCAIVIMISIGIGMKESQKKMLEQMGNLTAITVQPSPSKGKGKTKLNEEALKKFQKMPQVKLAAMKDNLDMNELEFQTGKSGRYQAESVTVVGVPETAFEQLGYKLKEGELPGNRPYEVLAGQYFAYQFADSKRPAGKNTVDYWMNQDAKPYFNQLKNELELVRKTEKTDSTSGGSESSMLSGNNKFKITPVQTIKVTGVLIEDYNLGMETSEGIVMKWKDLNAIRKAIAKLTGKKAGDEFSQVVVYVNDINQVEETEEQIKSMGFQTSSMESIRKPMEKEAKQKQLMLGGLGAISLLVAAIGIANTMIMSITERTREIGIMKALGCYVSDIRKEFLMEAGIIGFLGGVLGILISYGISAVMNTAAGQAMGSGFDDMGMAGIGMMEMGDTAASQISVIPLWLVGFALLFSIFIGVAAGYFPANKAVRISALEAIKY